MRSDGHRRLKPSAAMLAALVGLIGLPSRAWAGPPFITDDPEPVELHHWEFYLAEIGTYSADSVFTTAPHVEMNYGALPNLQLHIIAPMAYSASNGQSHYGYGDTEIGAKYRFLEEGDDVPQIGVFPLAEVPTGNAAQGLGSGQLQFFLPVWLQKSWGPWTTYGGGGYWINPAPGNQNWWFGGWMLQRDFSDALTLGGELYAQTAATAGGDGALAFNVGGQWNLSDEHHILFSVGRSLVGPVFYTSYFAYQLTI
ncbi:MAG TPA: hypothetical protein V6D47_13930 [Oscillatoriaceae cyanobacterium]